MESSDDHDYPALAYKARLAFVGEIQGKAGSLQRIFDEHLAEAKRRLDAALVELGGSVAGAKDGESATGTGLAPGSGHPSV